MTEVTSTLTPKTPRSLYFIGILAILWNAIGAFDYVMTEIRNPWYMSSFTSEQLAYFETFPMWATATWALGVWGGLLGSFLLLRRLRLTVVAFSISLFSATLTFIYNFVLTDGLHIMGGTTALIIPGIVLLVGTFLLFYSRRMLIHGIFR